MEIGEIMKTLQKIVQENNDWKRFPTKVAQQNNSTKEDTLNCRPTLQNLRLEIEISQLQEQAIIQKIKTLRLQQHLNDLTNNEEVSTHTLTNSKSKQYE